MTSRVNRRNPHAIDIKWSDLKVCGMPVLVDPDQDPATLKVYEGQTLVIEMHFDGDTFIGATGHVETAPERRLYA